MELPNVRAKNIYNKIMENTHGSTCRGIIHCVVRALHLEIPCNNVIDSHYVANFQITVRDHKSYRHH